MGLKVFGFPGCCGARILFGFYTYAPYKVTSENILTEIHKALGVKASNEYDFYLDGQGVNKKRDRLQLSAASAITVAIMTTAQRVQYHTGMLEAGFVEVAAGWNLSKDVHLYVLNNKLPRNMARPDLEALPAISGLFHEDHPFKQRFQIAEKKPRPARDSSGRFVARAT